MVIDGILESAKEFFQDEYNATIIYEELADIEKDAEMKKKLMEISRMERSHMMFWKDFLEKRNVNIEGKKRSFTIRYLKFFRKIVGIAFVSSLMEFEERDATYKYNRFLQSLDLDDEERRKILKIILDELEHEKYFFQSKEVLRSEHVRDFVMGMNDGLVEILGAVTGLSVVYIDKPLMTAISGIIVGVAGALSMAIGSFISVRSQRQVNEGIQNKLELVFQVSPEKAKEELYEKLVDSGMPEDLAHEVTSKISERKEVLTSLLTEESSDSELMAALYTGIAYLVGVIFPVIPYVFASSSLMALPFSIAFAGLALSIVAFLVSTISGISIRKKVVEMVVTGLGAAALSYLFGTIIQLFFGSSITI